MSFGRERQMGIGDRGEGILKKGEMGKDDAQMFIVKARVVAGWIEQEAVDALLAGQGGEEAPELTEEERALLALGELGNNVDDEDDEDEELGFDLADPVSYTPPTPPQKREV